MVIIQTGGFGLFGYRDNGGGLKTWGLQTGAVTG